ncbi:NUDIX domain-containing protein [bacterium]|nr:NUDIX domain-containing protein [bacterium]
MEKEKSAGAVVFREEDSKFYYLLLHYQSGHWDFPKGHIEKGEKEKETVRREIKEETGIQDIEFIPGFRERITYFFRKSYDKNKKPPLVFKEVVFYLVKTKTKQVRISYEHTGYKWLPYNKAIKQITFKNAKEILERANNYLSNKTYERI